jgi:hypothetical protein
MSRYYRFTYHSTSGGDDPILQALANCFGSVLVDAIIKTEHPLDDPQMIISYLSSRSDYQSFSSWDEFSLELVKQHLGSLEQKALRFAPLIN